MSFAYANSSFMLMSCVYVNQPPPTDPAEAGLGLVALMTWERGVCDRPGMTARAVGILVFTCILTVRAFYSSTNVIKLTSINFNSQVIQSDKLWLVEFYVHWCEHCERFVPEWIKVALALKGIVKVGAIDVTKYASIGHQYEIEEFPTIKFFGVNKNKPEKYYGGRSSAAITNGVLNSIRFIVRERLIEKSSICGSEGQCRRIMNKDAFELNDSNFDNQVAGGDEIWIVEFYAPWCEHCLSQEPTWTNAVVELARRTKGKIHLAAVDSSINVMLATRFGIQQVPTIKIFQTNKKIVDYNGEKSAPSIIAAGLELYSKMPLYKPFQQMVSEEILKTVCGLRVLCIIAVLPHISDTGNSGRSDYLGLLMKIAHKYKKKKWGWLWTESGAQPKLESALGIGGLAYPNIIAIDPRRKKYMFLKGSFSERGIAEFFRKLSMGHVSRIPMSDDFPKVKTVKCWDSKEGELPKEDPILLSGPTFQELENDELGKVFEYQDLKPGWLKAHGLPDSNDSWPPLYYSDMDYLQQATQSTGELPPMLPPQSFNATSKISKPISASSFRPTIGSDDHIF